MKKAIVLMSFICFIALTANTKTPLSMNGGSKKVEVKNEMYKESIAACNACIKSCNECVNMCSKDKGAEMTTCINLCKETIAACKDANKAMSANSKDVASMRAKCVTACEKSAIECEKFTNEHCKKCATDCLNAAKHCNKT